MSNIKQENDIKNMLIKIVDSRMKEIPKTISPTGGGGGGSGTDDVAEKWEYDFINSGKEVRILGYLGNNTKVTIPSDIEGKSVTTIGSGERYDPLTGVGNILELVIPDSVHTISDYAFYSQTGIEKILKRVIIGDGVQIIGWCAFYNCYLLEYISIGNGVKEIGDSAFQRAGRNSVSDDCVVMFGENVEKIGEWAFSHCYHIRNLNLPNKLKEIDVCAFESCGILELTIPESVESIGNQAFDGCSNAKKLTLNNTMTSINRAVFRSWWSLDEVYIPPQITTIGKQAFGNNGPETVYMSESCTYFYEEYSIDNSFRYEVNIIRYTGDIYDNKPLFFNNFAEFPTTGNEYHLYISKDTNEIYRWDSAEYIAVGGGSGGGADGKSAYEVAVQNGFSGTESEWLASLKGDKGSDGYTPIKGVDYFTTSDIENLGIENKVDKISGKGLSTNDLTTTLKSNYDTAYTNSHTHSNDTVLNNTTASYTTALNTKLNGIDAGAQVNQNAFATVVAGGISLVADRASDTLTVTAGSNVTITGTASSDAMTISATDTTYDNATTTIAGLMSATDKINVDDWSTKKSRFLNGTGTNAVILNVSSNSARGSHAISGGYDTSASGNYSTAFGYGCSTALYGFAAGYACKAQTNSMATAIGDQNTASGRGACALCSETTASGGRSFTANYKTIASADYSTAFGNATQALYTGAFAIGESTKANGIYSLAAGHKTESYQYQTVLGKFNATAYGQTLTSSTAGSPLVIGKGTSASALANCFRVETSGAVYSTGTYNTTGADYAEYFEWIDENPDNEDRRGLFVTLDGEYIRLADSNDDYILGIISANASVIGDSHEDQWNGMYLYDIYGSPVLEWVEEPAVLDDDGNTIQEAYMIQTQKLNPDYDPSEPYIPRSQRKEWSPVGMTGKLVVRDDGTCQVNSYCSATDGGIATASDIGYRVLSRLDKDHIKILIK